MLRRQQGCGRNSNLSVCMQVARNQFIAKNMTPNGVIIHYQGAYHSNNYEGILHYLKKTAPIEQMMTISTVTQEDVTTLAEENKGLADFIICVPETMTTTH